jgi:hypothetical protein
MEVPPSIVVVAALAASADIGPAGGGDHGDVAANEIGRERRQSIGLVIGPTYSIATFLPST